MSAERLAAKHYVYRLDHDTGFAPTSLATLARFAAARRRRSKSGRRPEAGSWGLAEMGRQAQRSDYLMKVESNPTVAELRRRSRTSPTTCGATGSMASSPGRSWCPSLLLFRKRAIRIPQGLEHSSFAHGLQESTDAEISRLVAHLSARVMLQVCTRSQYPQPHRPGRCGCSRATAKPKYVKRRQRPA